MKNNPYNLVNIALVAILSFLLGFTTSALVFDGFDNEPKIANRAQEELCGGPVVAPTNSPTQYPTGGQQNSFGGEKYIWQDWSEKHND